MKKFNREKFIKRCIQIFAIVVVLILLTLGISAIVKTAYFNNTYNEYNEKIYYKNDNIAINIFLTLISIIVIYALYKIFFKIKNKYLLFAVILIYAVLSVIWVIVSKTPLRADQKVIQDIATQFIDGNLGTLDPGQYLCYHPLQLGIIYFLEIIYRIFSSTNPIIFKMLNIIFSTIAMIYIYKISYIIFKNDKVQKILLILLCGNFIMIFFNVYVYGNIIGFMLGLIAIYYTLKYTENKKVRYLAISTISIVTAIALKSNYQIYLIGIIIILLLETFKKFDYKSIIAIFAMIILMTVVNKGIIKFTEFRYGKEINEGIPMISYIQMGMAEKVDRAAGWYNAVVNVEAIFRNNDFDEEKTSEYSKTEITKRLNQMLNNPKDAIVYYGDKILSTWIEPAFQTIWINEPQEEIEKVNDYISDKNILISLYDGTANKIIMKYFDIYDIIIFIFAATYLVINFKKINIKEISLMIIFFGGFAFHILWETKSIYAIPFFELLIPYASHGIMDVIQIIETKIKKKKRKKDKEIKLICGS